MSNPSSPSQKQQTPRRKGKGYRRHFKRPPKGCKYRQKRNDHPRDRPKVLDVRVIMYQQPSQVKPPCNLLSLFDGIAAGRHTLAKLNIDCQNYFSSEIDQGAIAIIHSHYRGHVTHLGPVQSITREVLECLPPINLLLGGSPCADFSRVNYRRKHFQPGSSGCLFYEYVRILELLQEMARRSFTPFYWLFENTSNMELEIKNTISNKLKCQPVRMCASAFKRMKRARFFWGNIPQMELCQQATHDKPLPQLEEILDPGRVPAVPVISTLTTNSASQRSGKHGLPVRVVSDNSLDFLNVQEEERLLGFPQSWTDAQNLTKSERRRLLGRTWDIQTAEHILRSLTVVFREAH